MFKKISSAVFCLIIALVCCINAFAAKTTGTLEIHTEEAGNVVILQQDNKTKYTGTSDVSGKILITGIQEGNYNVSFKNNRYQSFPLSVPYNNNYYITANPKKAPDITERPTSVFPTRPSVPSSDIPSQSIPNRTQTTRPSSTDSDRSDYSRPSHGFTDKNNSDKQYAITVSWENDNSNTRPKEVTVYIFVNNVLYKKMTISARDGWQKNILVKNGKITVTADEPAGYKTYISSDSNSSVIKNVYINKTENADIPFTGSNDNLLAASAFAVLIAVAMYIMAKPKKEGINE